ncbi:MOSC domain-containing protein [Trichophyton equinum CBS 127.97]|uniref:MOSC domain-containing protein n=1 Tax=Trichophyton equinum (strain ATCC MYA-4606 / CBS 127.97) TaxID=559882 RepID=F2PP23_TRIEC|nr:MOSC domain-containing protein [Trichophyton equinum CBS 127.97]
MQVSQIYVYPIKSMRPTTLSSAKLTCDGLPYDRTFMLLKVKPDGQLQSMHIDKFPQLSLFLTDIEFPASADQTNGGKVNGNAKDGKGWITVTYKNSSSPHPESGVGNTLRIPLEPETSHLRQFEVMMHRSPTTAYDMGVEYNSWFSAWLGFKIVFAYIGEHRRLALGNFASSGMNGGWMSTISSMIPVPIPGLAGPKDASKVLTFADMAPYLVVSQTSVDDVSSRLPPGEPMDVTKFRPNIVLAGALTAFEEDYWAELIIGDSVKVQLRNNCVRCVSVNVDFDTGAPHKGEAGTVLKKLMKDRRVDKGAKYSPVFGRYGFLHLEEGGSEAVIRVGDAVKVSKVNAERTTLEWPGMTN